MRPGSSLAVLLLSLVAAAHLLRLFFHVEVIAGGVVIPMWVSAIGVVVPTFIAVLLWREAREPGQAAGA